MPAAPEAVKYTCADLTSEVASRAQQLPSQAVTQAFPRVELLLEPRRLCKVLPAHRVGQRGVQLEKVGRGQRVHLGLDVCGSLIVLDLDGIVEGTLQALHLGRWPHSCCLLALVDGRLVLDSQHP